MTTNQSMIHRNFTSILTSIILTLILVAFYVIRKPNFLIDGKNIDKESLYNLLTVNTIFAGFIYTMLGNMVEFSARKDIQELDKAGYIDPYFSPMYFGLFYFLVSIFLELIIIFFGLSWKLNLFHYLSLSGTLLGLIFFVISTLKMRKMINKIRNKI
ncbi:hypothetical protein ABQD61_06310 [Enterococcus asini]|uniref:hypothetical protein n=1 Tax=Enterococcus asini TaxID=57732 RepID=UPI0032E507DF